MELTALTALGAIDGRYDRTARKLRAHLSEFALIKYRLAMQVNYLIALSLWEGVPVRTFSSEEREYLRSLPETLTLADARAIKDIETKGWGDIPKTNHDVVAVILWLREKLKDTTLADVVEWTHFALTSEDCNNIAYALMLRDAARGVLEPQMAEVLECFRRFAEQYADVPMLGRTHGQPATPTTLGKEFRVWYERLFRQYVQLMNFSTLTKLNGASGNYAAHMAALPEVEWEPFSEEFVRGFNGSGDGGKPLRLEWNPVTIQIEPHDTYAELFQLVGRFNTILIDACQDIWRYVSDGWLVQKAVAGEVGSSAMPQKVNPINFENAEGNLSLANVMFEFFARKLPISRLQRDLSDSTVERNFGYALGLTLKAWEEIVAGFGKISADEKAIRAALREHPEVLAEAYQIILRRAGVSGAYDLLKELTRGRDITTEDLATFVLEAKVPEDVRKELSALTPETYIGLAATLANS